MRQHHRRTRRLALQGAAAIALVALTAGVWWLWLGSDSTYQVDPATGVSSGPYEAPQIIACVLCLVVLAAAGALLLPPWLVVTATRVVTRRRRLSPRG